MKILFLTLSLFFVSLNVSAHCEEFEEKFNQMYKTQHDHLSQLRKYLNADAISWSNVVDLFIWRSPSYYYPHPLLGQFQEFSNLSARNGKAMNFIISQFEAEKMELDVLLTKCIYGDGPQI